MGARSLSGQLPAPSRATRCGAPPEPRHPGWAAALAQLIASRRLLRGSAGGRPVALRQWPGYAGSAEEAHVGVPAGVYTFALRLDADSRLLGSAQALSLDRPDSPGAFTHPSCFP